MQNDYTLGKMEMSNSEAMVSLNHNRIVWATFN